jgi:heparanase 1
MKKSDISCSVFFPGSPENALAVLQEDYLSFTIDTSLLLGGHWWGDSKKMSRGVALGKVEKLNLADARLIAFARLLSPAMLRIGGTEADRVKYRPGTKAVKAFYGQSCSMKIKQPEKNGESSERCEYIITKYIWKHIHEFIGKVQMSLLFTVSAGLSDRDADGVWQEENARRLIAYSVKKGYRVAAWEFGNEVNGFPFIYGWKNRVVPAQYLRDFARFGHLVKSLDPQSRIVGPSSAVWPRIGEPYPIIKKLCKSPAAVFLDAVSWHYYPQQSSRGRIATKRAGLHSMLSRRALDGIRTCLRKIGRALGDADKIRSNLSPTENWITETGHALYGGEPGLSDTFVSTLWWLDELGLLAREGASKVFRQSLVGSTYGLLDQTSFEPNPDYYASFLWKRIMGERVYSPEADIPRNSRLRVYLHRSTVRKQWTILLINLSRKKSERILLRNGNASERGITEKYLLQGNGGIRTRKLDLNGVPVAKDLAFKWEKRGTVEKYKIRALSDEERSGSFLLPPLSILFLK